MSFTLVNWIKWNRPFFKDSFQSALIKVWRKSEKSQSFGKRFSGLRQRSVWQRYEYCLGWGSSARFLRCYYVRSWHDWFITLLTGGLSSHRLIQDWQGHDSFMGLEKQRIWWSFFSESEQEQVPTTRTVINHFNSRCRKCIVAVPILNLRWHSLRSRGIWRREIWIKRSKVHHEYYHTWKVIVDYNNHFLPVAD